MRDIFDDGYANLYDLLYSDKDYAGEVQFVGQIFNSATRDRMPTSVLDLGCGTGKHLEQFDSAISKHGVDQSHSMIASAEKRRIPGATFTQEFVQNAHLGHTFDLVFSLFHVFSYQVTSPAALGMLHAIRRHLQPDGVAIIDFWHRAAWDKSPPETRVAHRSQGSLSLVRISEPTLDIAAGIVALDITMFVTNESGGQFSQVRENHLMRAYTLLEIELLSALAGLEVVGSGPWMSSDRELRAEDWYGWVALKHSSQTAT
jgi:SAM-dependent methyltransferase